MHMWPVALIKIIAHHTRFTATAAKCWAFAGRFGVGRAHLRRAENWQTAFDERRPDGSVRRSFLINVVQIEIN